MLLLADCCAVASPDLHERLLSGRTVAIACPKLDDVGRHVSRLSEILSEATPRALTVVHMEVPCCTGLVHAAIEAMELAHVDIPLRHIVIDRGERSLHRSKYLLPNLPGSMYRIRALVSGREGIIIFR